MRNIHMFISILTFATVCVQAADNDIASIVAFSTKKNPEPSELFYHYSERTENRLAIVAAYSNEPNITQDRLKDIALEFLDIAQGDAEQENHDLSELEFTHCVALELCKVPLSRQSKALNVTCIVLGRYIMYSTFIHPGKTEALFSCDSSSLYPFSGSFVFFNDIRLGRSGAVQDHLTAQQNTHILQQKNPGRPFHGAVNIKLWKEISRKKALSIRQAFGLPVHRKSTH